MSNSAVITAVLELNRGSFRTEQQKTGQELGQMQAQFKDSAAAVAVLERQLSSDKGNKALAASLSDAKKELRELGRELKLVELQKRALDAHLAQTPVVELPTQIRANASRASATITRDYRSAEDGPSGRGLHHGSGAQLMHSGRAIVEMMAAGQSPIRALEVEAPRLIQAFAPVIAHLGAMLAPIAALIGGGALIAWLKSAENEAKALRQQTAEIASNLGSISGADSAQLESRLKAAVENIQKVRDANGTTGNAFVNALTGRGVHDSDVRAAEQARDLIQQRMQGAQGRDLDFAKRSFHGDDGVEQEKVLVAYAQERDRIVQQIGSEELADATEAMRLAQERRDLALEELDVRRRAQQISASGEAQILGSRRRGDHADTSIAQDRLDTIRQEMNNGPHNQADWDKLHNRELSGELDLSESQHRDRERDIDLGTRTNNANLRGSDTAYRSAVNARDAIQAKIDDAGTKPDERKQLEAELAEARAEVRQQALASNQRAFEAERLDIQTNQTRGPRGRMDAIDLLMGVNARQQDWNTKKNGDDPTVSAQLTAEAAQLNREKQDIAIESERELAASKATTAEMDLRRTGHTNEANLTAIRAQYEEKIAGYLRDGKTEMAQQATLQKGMAVEAAKLAHYRAGPAGEARERMQSQADARDTAAMHKKESRDLEANRRMYEDANRSKLPVDPKARAAAISKAVPDLRGVATADPQGTAAAANKNDSQQVNLLGEIKSLLSQNLTTA